MTKTGMTLAMIFIVAGFLFVIVGYAMARAPAEELPTTETGEEEEHYPIEEEEGGSGYEQGPGGGGGGGRGWRMLTIRVLGFELNMFMFVGILLIIIGIILAMLEG